MQKRYDPKLREAMSQIEAIIKENDIGGFVIIGSKTFYEFKSFIDTPSWSQIVFHKKDGETAAVTFKARMKTNPQDTEASMGLLHSIRDMSGRLYMQTQEMINAFTQHIKVVHTPFSNLNNDDRDGA